MADPSGRIGHAEIQIGNARIMLADEHPEMGVLSPLSRGGATSSILLYVENVDARFAQAIAAGGTVARPLTDQFYGDRSGTLNDPFGHQWIDRDARRGRFAGRNRAAHRGDEINMPNFQGPRRVWDFSSYVACVLLFQATASKPADGPRRGGRMWRVRGIQMYQLASSHQVEMVMKH